MNLKGCYPCSTLSIPYNYPNPSKNPTHCYIVCSDVLYNSSMFTSSIKYVMCPQPPTTPRSTTSTPYPTHCDIVSSNVHNNSSVFSNPAKYEMAPRDWNPLNLSTDQRVNH